VIRPSRWLIAGLNPAAREYEGQGQALSLAPMVLKESRGILQISNRQTRCRIVEIRAYPVRIVNGVASAALQPYSPEEQQILVQLRPTSTRQRWQSSRTITYRILDPSRSFYICATSPQENTLLRICSRWQAPS
jgi:hypothetical protein